MKTNGMPKQTIRTKRFLLLKEGCKNQRCLAVLGKIRLVQSCLLNVGDDDEEENRELNQFKERSLFL
jgi:hypothetical protein